MEEKAIHHDGLQHQPKHQTNAKEEPSDFDPDLEDVIDLLKREEDEGEIQKLPYIFEGSS